MKHTKNFNEFLNENKLFEGDVNYRSDKFALVFIGGSIGSRATYPIFVSGSMGSIIETGNDKDVLKETAARMRKQLSPGEKKYYGMNYTVIELTPRKIQDIDYLINKQSETNGEKTED
jgi:hypothetical protein